MSDDHSARLALPYLAAGQMQKHVTLNEALTRQDALVQTLIVSRTTVAQPSAPEEGALYVLPTGRTGDGAADLVAGFAGAFETGTGFLDCGALAAGLAAAGADAGAGAFLATSTGTGLAVTGLAAGFGTDLVMG